MQCIKYLCHDLCGLCKKIKINIKEQLVIIFFPFNSLKFNIWIQNIKLGSRSLRTSYLIHTVASSTAVLNAVECYSAVHFTYVLFMVLCVVEVLTYIYILTLYYASNSIIFQIES